MSRRYTPSDDDIDWRAVIADLRAKNWTQMEVAIECKCGQTTISDLATGLAKIPSYKVGRSLERLYVSVMADDGSTVDLPLIAQARLG